MAMLDLLVEGATEITQPFISFIRQTGIGLGRRDGLEHPADTIFSRFAR